MSDISQKIKSLIENNQQAYFHRYFDGALWYRIPVGDRQDDSSFFEFPVPVTDVGTATFLFQDKAILMMRYIRKHIEMLEKAKVSMYPEPTC